MASSEEEDEKLRIRDEILECFITVYRWAEAGVGWDEDDGPPKEVEEAADRIYGIVTRVLDIKE